jgi:hypothetical protein
MFSLSLGSNNLNGTLPTEIGLLVNVEELTLGKLSGVLRQSLVHPPEYDQPNPCLSF